MYDADASAISLGGGGGGRATEVTGAEPNSPPSRQTQRRAEYMRPSSTASSSSSPRQSSRQSPSSSRPSPSSGAPRSPRPIRASKPKPKRSSPSIPTTPLGPTPTKVHYPSLNLAQLIKSDLEAHAASLRSAIGHSVSDGQEGEKEERASKRREAKGDYSRWMVQMGEEGGKGKGKKGDEVVKRAAGVLAANPSVSREGRDFLLGKVQGLLRK